MDSSANSPHDRMRRRLDRQFEALSRLAPKGRDALRALARPRLGLVRIPLGLAFVAGGLLAVLPLFGFWMLPIGALLLAFDLPALRPAVTSVLIRGRRRTALLRRRLRG